MGPDDKPDEGQTKDPSPQNRLRHLPLPIENWKQDLSPPWGPPLGALGALGPWGLGIGRNRQL